MSLPKEWVDMLSNTVESQVSNISAEVVTIEIEGVEVVSTQLSQECMEKAFVEEKKRGSKKTWGIVIAQRRVPDLLMMMTDRL